MKPVKPGGKRRFDPDSTPIIAAAGAGVLVILLGLSIILSSAWMHGSDTGIILPGSDGDSPNISTGSALFTAESVAEVNITKDNAKTIIATLARPAAYTGRVSNTLYYDGGEATKTSRRYVLSGVTRTDTLNADGAVQSTLIRKGDAVYAWNAGDSRAYQGAAGGFSDDAAAMLPTWEDVLSEDVVLTEAKKENLGYEPCITVTFERDGYRCVYAVSTVTGLLRQAAFYDGDTLARKVAVGEVDTTPPDGSLFTLPDGTALV